VSVNVVLQYSESYKRTVKYIKTGYFCPECGKAEVWCEDDGLDYYLGVTYACTGCDSLFALANATYKPNSDDTQSQITPQLRARGSNG
jgi:hypothetical protein